MCKGDVVLEKIKNLSEKIESNSQQNIRELDLMNERLRLINSSILSLDHKVNTQNGRITKMEVNQQHCPGLSVNKALLKYKDELKPVYIVATNLKLIIFLVVGFALFISVLNVSLEWILALIGIRL